MSYVCFSNLLDQVIRTLVSFCWSIFCWPTIYWFWYSFYQSVSFFCNTRILAASAAVGGYSSSNSFCISWRVLFADSDALYLSLSSMASASVLVVWFELPVSTYRKFLWLIICLQCWHYVITHVWSHVWLFWLYHYVRPNIKYYVLYSDTREIFHHTSIGF